MFYFNKPFDKYLYVATNTQYVLLHYKERAVIAKPYFRKLSGINLAKYLEHNDKFLLSKIV